jgi:hypothetical protein
MYQWSCWKMPEAFVYNTISLQSFLNFNDVTNFCMPHGIGSSSESELLYDWRFTANQFVLAPSPLRLTAGDIFLKMYP